MNDDQLKRVLRSWIDVREEHVRRHHVINMIGASAGANNTGFLQDLRGHAIEIGNVLPTLSLAETEALHELVGSYLAELRLRRSAFGG